MKVAFTLDGDIRYARFLAYAIEHGINVVNCLKPRRDRENNGFFIDWIYHFAYCKPLDMLRRDGYYITNNVDFSYNNEGECTLSVMIDYERIYN